MAVNKVYADATEALAGLLHNGMTIMAGGFGLCGIPQILIEAVRASGAKDLICISNNAGVDEAFFSGTSIRSNFICALGRGIDESFPRLPRLAFADACQIV